MNTVNHGDKQLLVTTIGDLVAAVIDAAREAVNGEEEACLVAGLVVNNILSTSANGSVLSSGIHGGRTIRDA